MITLQTITTIELSNLCNLSCLYCVNRKIARDPARVPGIMTDAVFGKSLALLAELCRRGTQRELFLNGNGESCLDPQLPARVSAARAIIGPDRMLGICTNAVNLTPALVAALKLAGLSRLDLSPHSPYHVRRAVPMLRAVEMAGSINPGPLTHSHNWAGQLEPEHTIAVQFSTACEPLAQGRGYICAEGGISPCCYDYGRLGEIGDVFDDDILSRPIEDFALCHGCHQKISPETLARIRERRPRQSLQVQRSAPAPLLTHAKTADSPRIAAPRSQNNKILHLTKRKTGEGRK